jgi:hypothetical protein
MKNTRSRIAFLPLSIVAACSALPAMAAEKEPHLDIWLRPTKAGVLTGSITEGTPGEPVAERADVFSGDFGSDPKFPFAAFEPGFQALATGFQTTFSFEIAGPLQVYAGGSFVPTTATMTLSYGPSSITSTEGTVGGFTFSTFASGLLHDHFDYILNGVAGADPAAGVYALPLRFAATAPAADPGNVAWVVLNAGESEAVHEEAIRAAELFLACGIDLDADGSVGATDLAALLGGWGGSDESLDLDRDGSIGASDLAALLGAWGFNCGG